MQFIPKTVVTAILFFSAAIKIDGAPTPPEAILIVIVETLVV